MSYNYQEFLGNLNAPSTGFRKKSTYETIDLSPLSMHVPVFPKVHYVSPTVKLFEHAGGAVKDSFGNSCGVMKGGYLEDPVSGRLLASNFNGMLRPIELPRMPPPITW